MSSTHGEAVYDKQILKKFLFQVHPDYFEHFKIEQQVNASNIKILTSPTERDRETARSRSLTFYVKPGSEDDAPRRVKVTLSRVTESIREILETMGLDLPVKPEGLKHEGFVSQSSSAEFFIFVDSLVDRRELMRWRQERMESFSTLKDTIWSRLGVESIEFRYNWSAQNNTVLLLSLLRMIDSNSSQLYLPWSGMNLVLSFDDSSLPIDPMERQILIDPCQLPEQWMRILRRVDAHVVAASSQENASLQALTAAFCLFAAERFRFKVAQAASTRGSGAKLSRLQLNNLTVDIKKGHTCSRLNLKLFMEKILASSAHSFDSSIQEEPVHSEFGLVVVNWIQEKMLPLVITVEEGYGTKLLANGEIRADCRAHPETVWKLIDTKGLECVQLAAQYQRQQFKIQDLRSDIMELISVASIEAGVGVDAGMMEHCLDRMRAYLKKSDSNVHKLRHMHGLHIRVGKYLGIADDGACIIPWDQDF